MVLAYFEQARESVIGGLDRLQLLGEPRASAQRGRLAVKHDVKLTGPVLTSRPPTPLDPLPLIRHRGGDHNHPAVGVRRLVHHLVVVSTPTETVGYGHAAAWRRRVGEGGEVNHL